MSRRVEGVGAAAPDRTGPAARLAVVSDLAGLIDLCLHLNPRMPQLSAGRAEQIWQATLMQPGLLVFVRDMGSRLAASGMLVIAPNLMRGGQEHAFIEIVVTHADFRRNGHGRAIMQAAFEPAWQEDCHHVLLQSGRADPGVHRFYERCGMVPGVSTAYVARRPK